MESDFSADEESLFLLWETLSRPSSVGEPSPTMQTPSICESYISFEFKLITLGLAAEDSPTPIITQ